MPCCVASEVESFTFIPSPGRDLRINAAVATYDDRIRITFGIVTDVTELERRFFRTLVDEGVHVKVYRYKDI